MKNNSIVEKFKLIKGSKTYYLGSEGNIKDSFKNYVYKFEKLKLDYSYSSISIYKEILEYDDDQWTLEYTIPIENSKPGKIFMRFPNIKAIIKYRKSSEEYNDMCEYVPCDYEEFILELRNEYEKDANSDDERFYTYLNSLN